MSDIDLMRASLCVCSTWIAILQCSTLQHAKEFQTSIGIMMKSLACADVLFLLVCNLEMFRALLDLTLDAQTYNILSFIVNLSHCVTVVTFGYISVDRFFAVLYPKEYLTVMTNYKANCCVWISYIGSGLALIPSIRDWDPNWAPPRNCLLQWQNYSSSGFMVLLVLSVTSLFVTVVCMFCILQAIEQGELGDKHLKKVRDDVKVRIRQDKRITKVLLAACILFYMMWLPFFLLTFVRTFTEMSTSSDRNNTLLNLGIAYPLIKFTLCLCFLPAFREGILESFLRVVHKCCDCLCNSESPYVESTVPQVWNEIECSLEEHFLNMDRSF